MKRAWFSITSSTNISRCLPSVAVALARISRGLLSAGRAASDGRTQTADCRNAEQTFSPSTSLRRVSYSFHLSRGSATIDQKCRVSLAVAAGGWRLGVGIIELLYIDTTATEYVSLLKMVCGFRQTVNSPVSVRVTAIDRVVQLQAMYH